MNVLFVEIFYPLTYYILVASIVDNPYLVGHQLSDELQTVDAFGEFAQLDVVAGDYDA